MNDNRVLHVESLTRLESKNPQRVSVTDEEADHGSFNLDESAEDQIVKYFIMNSKTAEFVRCDSLWTPEFKEALDFLSVQGAICWGVKELKASFQIVKIQMNRVLGSIKIVIPPLFWSTANTPHTIFEFCQGVLLAEARQSPVDVMKPAGLIAPTVLAGRRGVGVARGGGTRPGGKSTHLYLAGQVARTPVLERILVASLAACGSRDSVALRK